jgi:hypothetical protein
MNSATALIPSPNTVNLNTEDTSVTNMGGGLGQFAQPSIQPQIKHVMEVSACVLYTALTLHLHCPHVAGSPLPPTPSTSLTEAVVIHPPNPNQDPPIAPIPVPCPLRLAFLTLPALICGCAVSCFTPHLVMVFTPPLRKYIELCFG